MPKHHAPYAPEFRAEAVRLVRAGGRTPQQRAHDLACSDETIRTWLRQADRDEGRRGDGLITGEREELAQPRRENRVRREEQEILRKAAAVFAQEATR